MRNVKLIFIAIFLAGFTVPIYAKSLLTADQIERVKVCKKLLSDVDKKSLQKTIDEIESSDYPQVNLEIMEAVARTYADIVKEQAVENKPQKEWLYSMVALNMAYLQFGGERPMSGSSAGLNRLILKKLRQYLSPELLSNPGFLYTIEE